MNIKKMLISLFYVILVILIVSSIYFLGVSFILQIILNFSVIYHSLFELLKFSLDTFSIFYANTSLYFLDDIFTVRTFSNIGLRHIYNEINSAKIIVNWYFYPKFVSSSYYINVDAHYVMNYKPYLGFTQMDIAQSKNLFFFDGYFVIGTTYSDLCSLDYFWGSFRAGINEGDFTLMPDEYYQLMIKRLVNRFLKYTIWMSGSYLYIPSWAFYK